ncbi:MAG: diguanylate cyclase [Solirubrobacterales bacterium]
MSFRGRLTLFFVLIVVLPMIALAALVVQIAGDSASGKADARLAAGLETAIAVYEDRIADAGAVARRIAADSELESALRAEDADRVESVARALRREHGAASLVITDAAGEQLVAAGSPQPLATASLEIAERAGAPVATLDVSTTSVPEYLMAVSRITDRDAAVLGPDGLLSATVPLDGDSLPTGEDAVDVELEGEELRAASAPLPGGDGLRVAVLGPRESEGFLASSPRIAAVLVAFFGIALLAVVMITRALQGQVRAMLDAARGIGEGDFSREVPVVGGDEMAGLASEFNKMSGRLSDQMGQLRRQQVEIDRSVRRIGEAFASGLDREALLGILVETAVGAVEADYGLIVLSGRVGAEAEAGTPTEPIRDVALAAEHRAWRRHGLVEEEQGAATAIASSLGQLGGADDPVGVMTVARDGRPFSGAERDVFLYLLGQAAASVENVALHELVSEQAVTDELTGLPNNRAFHGAIRKEAARADRFRHELSLLILDIDDFKQVNDTYGHLQGDAVLRRIGKILDAESRGIDEPARYGGEEFVVALPETGSAGAVEVAERIRERIAAEPIPIVDGKGELRVTASLGAATMPAAAHDVPGLIAAADAALYAAKRAGKNRVHVAGDAASGAGDGKRKRAPAAKGRGGRRRS